LADAASSLPQNSRSIIGGGIGPLGKALVSAQTAFCILLVIGAALFAATMQKLRSFDAGFRRDGVLMMQLFPQPGREKISNRTAYYRELAEGLRSIPGVAAVSYSNMGPAARTDFLSNVSAPFGLQAPAQAVTDSIGPGFFHLIGMQVLKGREFSWTDDTNSARVAILSESLAKRLFPGQNPLGQKIDMGSSPDQTGIEIVGVVNSASLWRLQSQKPMAAYRPLMQTPTQNEPLLDIRTAADPHAMMGAARRVLEAAGHHYPLRMQTLLERSEMVLANERVLAMISMVLAALALLMGAIGIYGLLSYAVTRRAAEMGLRMALGAQPREIMNLILGEMMLLVGTGIALGVVAEIVVSRFVGAVFFGVSGSNPAMIIFCCGILGCIAFVAGYAPARRAARLDPMNALRTD
jgi:predicted permease